MAQRIAELGGSVRRMTTLSDDMDDIFAALHDSLQRRTAVILTTGGLGPTPDDLTVEAVCRVIGRESAVHEPTLDDYIRRRNLTGRDQISPGLFKMATVPEGSEVFPNPAGWAPCTVVPAGERRRLILPGPPR